MAAFALLEEGDAAAAAAASAIVAIISTETTLFGRRSGKLHALRIVRTT